MACNVYLTAYIIQKYVSLSNLQKCCFRKIRKIKSLYNLSDLKITSLCFKNFNFVFLHVVKTVNNFGSVLHIRMLDKAIILE